MAEVAKRLVLLNYGDTHGRGAWFDVTHRAALVKAATQPNHALLELETTKFDQVDPDIPKGTMLASGTPDELPIMIAVTFQRLLELAPAGGHVTGIVTAGKGKAPSPWSEIVVGSIVLASESQEDGWWECVVLSLESGGNVRLRWRDFPGWDPFLRSITRVGLLPTSGMR